jgi:hypothetical protein
LALLLPVTGSAQTLDLKNPDDVVKANRKIMASLEDGKPITFYFEGNVYSRVPGEKDRHLFSYQAFNTRATKTLTEEGKGYGYRHVSRELVVYLDPKTKEVLRTWKNPWTGKEVEVMHVANDPVNSRGMFAQGPRGPAKWMATCIEDWCSMGFEVPLFYKNPMSGDYEKYIGGTYHAIEMFLFYFRKDEVVGPGDTAPVSVGWTRVSKWLPWMEMGDRAGWVMFSGRGGKILDWESMPETIKKEVAANYPEYRTPPPLDDDRPNETSWTYFKKQIDAKRAKEPAKKKEEGGHD